MVHKIEFLQKSDLKIVQEFIDHEWSPNHILVKSKKLFDWQYERNGDNYNFIISKRDDEIIGVLGFINTFNYDKTLSKENIIWLALWKIKDGLGIPGLGLKMLNFLQENIDHDAIAVNGINLSHPPMYKALGYLSDELSHFYTTHQNSKFKILDEFNEYEHPKCINTGNEWLELNESKMRELNQSLFKSNSYIKKSIIYFINRYLKHPFYKYYIYLIQSPNSIEKSLISLRFDNAKGSKVIRIVDYFGNPEILRNAGKGLNIIMKDNKVEYADFWSYGIDNEIMESIGFKLITKSNKIVVPNYFEPFIKSNASIQFAFKSKKNKRNQNLIIFKADGDQDRPNVV